MPQGKNCPKRMISPCGVGAFFPKVSTEENCSEEDASMAHPTLDQKQGTIVNVVALGLDCAGHDSRDCQPKWR
jgi:hypothetical protein